MKQEILRFENVTCKKDGAVYLDNFSFYMTAGEIVGMLSVNDRGIQELIELTAKNHPIDAGRVYMGGKLVNSYLNQEETSNRIYQIDQKSSLINDLSIADNLFVMRPGFKKQVINEWVLREQADRVLKQLSMERIRDELFKLFLTPKVIETLQIMYDNEILSYILPDTHYLEELDFLVNTINTGDLPNAPLRRLFVLYNPDEALAENLATRLRMSNKQREDFVSWARFHPFFDEFLEEKPLRRLVYLHGNDFCRDKLILLSAFNRRVLPDIRERIKHIAQIKLPEFSIKGRDVIAAGIKDNRKIGEVLDELEQIWIDSDFNLSHEELLQRLPELILQKSA